ncbi:MAG: FIST C-terminal domain-containing protein [Chitinophagaceae bacterium]|nr:FIST C-terminal domain-containing protein [Chitinophagaceae bacterium]
MKAKSIIGKSTEEIKTALDQSIDAEFKPTLAIIFASLKPDRVAIRKMLDDAGIAIFGATTNGEFIDEETGDGAAAILLLNMDTDYFTIFFDEYPDKNYREKASAIAKKALQKFTNPAFLISYSNTETDAEQLLLGIEDVIGKHVNVYGGGAGDNYTFLEQFVFSNNKESSNGMIVLVLDEDKIKIKGRATCGWKAVGTERTVTKSEGNHVFTVDNIPVLDMTAKYGGIENVTPDNKNLMLEIATSFPLQMQREAGDPLMRPGLKLDWSDHSFYCSGSVPQGSKVRFSLPPDFDVVEKVISDCINLKATEMPDADAVIIFSCAGRQVALGPMIQQEIEGLKNIWNVPMAGFFSNAELARANGGNLEMHNLTNCCVVLKEK